MSDEWYSLQPRSRFSREHRDNLPCDARMVDLDQVLWVFYDLGVPFMLAERKPQDAKEDYWPVTRQLAQMAGLPAAKIIEQRDGGYTIYVASERTDYEPHLVGRDMTIEDWYQQIELPLRNRAGMEAA